jgi:hypothetical protein
MKILQTIGAFLLISTLAACGGGSSACGPLLSGVCTDASNIGSSSNAVPVANAGPLQNVTLVLEQGVLTKLVTLDGTGSTDGNNDTLTFKWTLTEKPVGSKAELSDSTAAKPSFKADLIGVYRASLVVKDGKIDSSPSTVVISAAISNSAPVANAGPKQYVVTGATVALDGTYSTDADNNQLTYSWKLLQWPASSSAESTFEKTLTARPSFTADKAGDYIAQLIVNDGYTDSKPSTVIVVSGPGNVAPVSNAGDDQNVSLGGGAVRLDGSLSSDANADTLSYKWDWMSYPGTTAPTLSTSNTSSRPSFTPPLAGTYVLTLTVSDGKLSSSPDPITITVAAAAVNSAPVAVAGSDQNNIELGTAVTLNGAGSTDANQDTLTYTWTLSKPSGSSTAVATSYSGVSPTFTPDVSGVYVASLVVYDSKVYSSNQSLTRITVIPVNTAPVAVIASVDSITGATATTLNGSASTDANSDSLTYKWYLTTKPSASSGTSALATTTSTVLVASATTPSAPIFTPDAVGTYVVTLIVNDGKVDSMPATVTITRN